MNPEQKEQPPVQRSKEDDHVLLSDARGEIRVASPAPAVVVVSATKFTSEALVRATTAEVDSIVARARTIDFFFDTQNAPGYEPGVRSHMQAWSKRQSTALRSHHVLLPPGHKLLAMTLSVANMVIGGAMQVYAQRTPFETALRAAVQGRTKTTS